MDEWMTLNDGTQMAGHAIEFNGQLFLYVREMGLAVFSDDGVKACLGEAYAAMEEMCLRYDSRAAA